MCVWMPLFIHHQVCKSYFSFEQQKYIRRRSSRQQFSIVLMLFNPTVYNSISQLLSLSTALENIYLICIFRMFYLWVISQRNGTCQKGVGEKALLSFFLPARRMPFKYLLKSIALSLSHSVIPTHSLTQTFLLYVSVCGIRLLVACLCAQVSIIRLWMNICVYIQMKQFYWMS